MKQFSRIERTPYDAQDVEFHENSTGVEGESEFVARHTLSGIQVVQKGKSRSRKMWKHRLMSRLEEAVNEANEKAARKTLPARAFSAMNRLRNQIEPVVERYLNSHDEEMSPEEIEQMIEKSLDLVEHLRNTKGK